MFGAQPAKGKTSAAKSNRIPSHFETYRAWEKFSFLFFPRLVKTTNSNISFGFDVILQHKAAQVEGK